VSLLSHYCSCTCRLVVLGLKLLHSKCPTGKDGISRNTMNRQESKRCIHWATIQQASTTKVICQQQWWKAATLQKRSGWCSEHLHYAAECWVSKSHYQQITTGWSHAWVLHGPKDCAVVLLNKPTNQKILWLPPGQESIYCMHAMYACRQGNSQLHPRMKHDLSKAAPTGKSH